MAELDGVQSYIVDGYVFLTKADYEEALQEKKAVKYLSSQMGFDNVEGAYKLYTELIDKKILYTPIGMDYLKKLREAILKNSDYTEKMLLPIPVATSGQKEKARVEKYISTKYEAESKEFRKKNSDLKKKLITSVMFNIVFAIIIAAMFFIVRNSSAPNILNYERVIQDKYSVWEQQLKEKQQQLKDLEWELKQKEEGLNSQN